MTSDAMYPGSDLSHTDDRVMLAENLLRLVEERHAHRCGLLIDPVLRDARHDLVKRWTEYGRQPPVPVPVRLAPGLIDKSHWPVLLEVDLTTLSGHHVIADSLAMALEDWRAQSLRQGNGHRICAWIVSNRPWSAVAAHLALQLVQSRRPGRRTLLRFYDPAVVSQMWTICTAAQRRALLGPVECWIAMRPDRTLFPYATGESDRSAAVTGEFPAFDAAQWMRLDHIGPINRALSRLPTYPDDYMMQQIADALVRAQSQGFSNPDDLVEFAWRACSISPRFDSHSTVRKCIDRKKSGDSFGYVTADLTEAQWHAIAMDLNAGETP